MQMTPVSSSNIRAIGYMGGVLRVTFFSKNSEETYDHEGVPAGVYQQFLAAASKGSFYHEYIKGKYAYKKLGKA